MLLNKNGKIYRIYSNNLGKKYLCKNHNLIRQSYLKVEKKYFAIYDKKFNSFKIVDKLKTSIKNELVCNFFELQGLSFNTFFLFL